MLQKPDGRDQPLSGFCHATIKLPDERPTSQAADLVSVAAVAGRTAASSILMKQPPPVDHEQLEVAAVGTGRGNDEVLDCDGWKSNEQMRGCACDDTGVHGCGLVRRQCWLPQSWGC